MRKVTIDTCEAFIGGETKSISNTVSTGTELILHGNVIARKTEEGAIVATLADWPTPTTRERLNGLCRLLGIGGFHQYKREQYFQGNRIDPTDWVTLVQPSQPEQSPS